MAGRITIHRNEAAIRWRAVKPPRWARWVGGILAVLVLVAGAAIYLALRCFDRERIAGPVAEEVRRATGRQIHFDGPIGFRLLPSLAFTLDQVRLANASWGTRPEMIKAAHLELDVALRPLFSRRLLIRRVVLDGVELWLETDAKGHGNWVMRGEPRTAQRDEPAPGGQPLAIDLSQAEIRASTISLRDGRTGRTETLVLERVSLQDDGSSEKLDAQLRLRQQPLSIKGSTGKIAQLFSGADKLPLDLTLAIEGASVGVKGGIGLAANAGKASIDLDARIRATTALAKLASGELPLPLPLRFSGRLEQDGSHSVLPAFKLEVGGQAVAGKAQFDASGKRPRLELAARADAFDLGALWPTPAKPTAGAARPPRAGRLFGDERLPLPALPALDASVDLVVAKLGLPGKPPLSAVHAALTLADGQITLQPLAFALGSASVDAAATLRLPAGGVPVLSLHLRSGGITLQEWLALTGASRAVSGGRTELRLDLAASGASPHQLARSLDGELRLEVGRARLSGDLGGDLFTRILDSVNPFYRQDHGSSVICAAARLPIRQGAIVVDRSIAVESEKINVVVAGNIDLGAETVDLAIRPAIKEGVGVGAASLAQLVKLSGSLSNPGIGVNLEGAVREGVSIGAAVATGGLSLLGERMLRDRVDPHPCVAAMRAPPSAAAPPKPPPAPAKKEAKRPRLFG
jgi:uncharacterized protein involved in outer membrane biogenesis